MCCSLRVKNIESSESVGRLEKNRICLLSMFASPLIHREDDLLHEILDCENISRESSLLRFLINKNNYQIKFLYIETYVFRKISTYITQKKINISINISFEDSKRNVTFSPFT